MSPPAPVCVHGKSWEANLPSTRPPVLSFVFFFVVSSTRREELVTCVGLWSPSSYPSHWRTFNKTILAWIHKHKAKMVWYFPSLLAVASICCPRKQVQWHTITCGYQCVLTFVFFKEGISLSAFRGLSCLSPDHQCSQVRVRFDLPLIPSSWAHTEIALVPLSCVAPWCGIPSVCCY